MVSPSVPLLISLLLSFLFFFHPLFSLPHLHTVPASFPQLLSQAGHNIGGVGEALCVEWRVGRDRRCVYGCDERRRQLLTYQCTVYIYRCVCMCVGMRACTFACLRDMLMRQLLSTHQCCCSNSMVASEG